MAPLIERLQQWLDADREDTIILTRGEILQLLDKIGQRQTQRDGYAEAKESNRE
jgi:hypothetical protein